MGTMRFDLGSAEIAAQCSRFEHAFVTNYDGASYPGEVEVQGTELQFTKECSGSGKLNIPWSVQGFGDPVLRTGSLLERDTPYVLAVELARGQLGELREQHATWSEAGMLIPEEYEPLQKAAHKDFRAACLKKDHSGQATVLANKALQTICEAEDMLANSYIQQRLHVRRQRHAQHPALFGCDLGTTPTSEIPENFSEVFGAAGIHLAWKDIEPEEGKYQWDRSDQLVDWAMENKLLLKGGPLLNFQENGLPTWLTSWKHDILNLQSFLSNYTETVVSKYVGKIRIWEVAARMNTGGLFGYTEENILALTARMIDVTNQVDSEGQIFIRVDRPWGDYQAKGKHRLTPCHAVDALLRSGTGLTGINLELAIGYEPGCNDARRSPRFSKNV
ncbi:MAG: endo-1,4-beta-xylanase, partial [Planctomycetaceae bacterium]|nr:endo-1,4-beta-xylanase [Planctomycetaceae bacterium]